MTGTDGLVDLMQAIGAGHHERAHSILERAPELVTAALARADERFIAECHAQIYAGDTALHAASFAYDVELVRRLIASGADVRARNRRGAEPLHAAAIGQPGSGNWNPEAQSATIAALVVAGADPNARAAGGVTPLHRAVRNRCAAAVAALLDAGANPELRNDNGSNARDLARGTTGRTGSGSPAAHHQLSLIVAMLTR